MRTRLGHGDGRILLAGGTFTGRVFAFRVAPARYLAAGSLDASFGQGGIVRTAFGEADALAHAVALQGSDRVVVAGVVGEWSEEADAVVARYEW